ncbi:hypothetical protein [Vibrio mangrovi]|uniref:Pyridoxamine 5'-phosphate oxidase n=1 Tax=Vibrio mangrovi TaxID=474394 RepID=A0A1Y6J255_9VIBR|nr:hypothetical protein [Vibrio mangrovi]MDW6002914.1 hypothetical protein [Vibrio mangrovi]SMS02403.1 hypothetical protein VIM7927_03725 [Vibrio mangrovi]
MENQPLSEFIGRRVLGVLGTYASLSKDMDVYICGVEIVHDTRLKVLFPKGHKLTEHELVTLHLDNRTGVSEYDADLNVFRLSYKGMATIISEYEVIIEAVEYQVFYGMSVVKEYRTEGYQYPDDQRNESPLPISPLTNVPAIDDEEHDNKIGVLLTLSEQQPHTTVMAFLSSVDDDIFFITLPSTFKSKLLKRDNRCYFAIDSRATFTFEQAIEWNYSIIRGEVYQIPKTSPVFAPLQELFITKNPWEMGFFSHPEIEMYHLKALRVVCPKKA